jgi:hypothetical protein
MNENKKTLYAVFIFLIIGFGLVQTKRSTSDSEISEDEIMGHIRYLSHEKRGGRYPGSRGSKDVIAYITKQFKSYGVQPGVKNSFVQPFEINSDIVLGDSNYVKVNNKTLSPEIDYIPFSFSSSGVYKGEAVFAGYGFKINTDDLVWNDYKSINVKGKWVIVMRHSPERDLQHSVFLKHSSLHKKMLVARDEGALGIIFISQIEDPNLYPLKYLDGYKDSGIPVLHLSNSSADKILKKDGWTREQIQDYMNTKLKPLSFTLSETIEAKVNLSLITSRAANIIGLIKSGNREFRDEYIVIGAHFDHVGNGGHSSGSRKPETVAVHPGADDNASGTAGLLELAQKLASQKGRLKRSILLIGFDAEEKGLLGSKYFIENPSVDISKIKAMINMDMIGRMKDSTFTVGGVGSSPVFENLLDSLSAYKNFKLNKTKPGYGPSDHASFYSKNIPVLFFFSGFHDEYHTPEDTWKLINLKGQKQILNLVYDLTFNLSRSQKPPSFSEAGPKNRSMETRSSFKVTFGIVPSYSSSVIGLEIDQISDSKGPAARAGLINGDVIKSINGKKINDIYEYMERLSELNPGLEVPVEIDRKGSKMKLNIKF